MSKGLCRVAIPVMAILPATGCATEVVGSAARPANDSLSSDAIGLALEVDTAVPGALAVRRGQTFYINQIDLRASVTATIDEDVAGLSRRGDFARLDWRGIADEEQEFVLLASADGTFRRRRFFRDAAWMKRDSELAIDQ